MANTEIPQVNIDSTLHETRQFEPSKEFSERAHIKSREEYDRIYAESINDPEKFWGGIASDLHWFKKWDKVLDWNVPWAKWFVGGQINRFSWKSRSFPTC
jgi:acetyl-CoA synthetase